jgi:hypothetical protein
MSSSTLQIRREEVAVAWLSPTPYPVKSMTQPSLMTSHGRASPKEMIEHGLCNAVLPWTDLRAKYL